MEQTTLPKSTDRCRVAIAETSVNNEANSSGVSWPAGIGRGFVTGPWSTGRRIARGRNSSRLRELQDTLRDIARHLLEGA